MEYKLSKEEFTKMFLMEQERRKLKRIEAEARANENSKNMYIDNTLDSYSEDYLRLYK